MKAARTRVQDPHEDPARHLRPARRRVRPARHLRRARRPARGAHQEVQRRPGHAPGPRRGHAQRRRAAHLRRERRGQGGGAQDDQARPQRAPQRVPHRRPASLHAPGEVAGRGAQVPAAEPQEHRHQGGDGLRGLRGHDARVRDHAERERIDLVADAGLERRRLAHRRHGDGGVARHRLGGVVPLQGDALRGRPLRRLQAGALRRGGAGQLQQRARLHLDGRRARVHRRPERQAHDPARRLQPRTRLFRARAEQLHLDARHDRGRGGRVDGALVDVAPRRDGDGAVRAG